MRITVTRTGGFAGITRRAGLDTTGLPDAAELAVLARTVLSEGTRQDHVVPDGFHYEIEADGRTVYAADPGLTDAQRSLITRVLREGA
jgi:hypothetical protein